MYKAVQAAEQPRDADLRHPPGAAKAVNKIPAQRSNKGAAACEEGSGLAGQLRKRQRKAAATCAADAAAKRRRTGRRGKVVESSEECEDSEGSQGSMGDVGGSECDVEGGEDAAADGSGKEDLQEEVQQQQQQQHGCTGAIQARQGQGGRSIKLPARFQQ